MLHPSSRHVWLSGALGLLIVANAFLFLAYAFLSAVSGL